MKHMNFFWEDESGQGLLEYGLIVALIALVVVAAMSFMGPIVYNLFSSDRLTDALSEK